MPSLKILFCFSKSLQNMLLNLYSTSYPTLSANHVIYNCSKLNILILFKLNLHISCIN